MRFSVITALYNKCDLTRAFWESLVANPPPEPWEMIWVDDQSTDDTRVWLATLHSDRHRVLLNEENLGFAASNNRGARAATGDFLLFLNNDLVLTPGWLAPMLSKLEEDPKLGIVGNVQLSPATGLIDHAGVTFDLVGTPIHHLKNRPREVLSGDGIQTHAVTAACWLMKRDLFLGHGGFDEIYRNGGEDIDLAVRLHEAGYRHWVDYRSVIWHHVSSSPGRHDYDLKNQAIFLKRWGKITSAWGRRDWPREYLHRVMKNPARLNAGKTLDAILRTLGLRHGDSAWAATRRQKLMHPGTNGGSLG